MLVVGIIMLVVAIAMCLTLGIFYDTSVDKGIFIIMLLLSIIGTLIIDTSISQVSPKAIDVYRGKTTLQITYQDSIPIDSVVVFKK